MKNIDAVQFYRNLAQQLENETVVNNIFNDFLKKIGQKSEDELYDKLHEMIKMDEDGFIEFFANKTNRKAVKKDDIIYKVICDYYQLESSQQAIDLLKYYGKLLNIYALPSLGKKINSELLKQAFKENIDNPKKISSYIDIIISKMVSYNDFSPKDLKNANHPVIQTFKQLIDCKENMNEAFVEENIDKLIQYEKMQNYLYKEKILNKLYHKTNRKFNQILKRNISKTDQINMLMFLLETTKRKIEDIIQDDEYDYNHEFESLFNQINFEIEQLKTKEVLVGEKKAPKEKKLGKQQLMIVENFFTQYHLYYKKKKITEEINEFPFILEFYHRFKQILETCEVEKKVNQLEELVGDISESDVKRMEAVRPLLNIIRKNIEDLLSKEEDLISKEELLSKEDLLSKEKEIEVECIEENIEDHPIETHQEITENLKNHIEEKTDDLTQPSKTVAPIVQVGKFILLKDSEQTNPLSIHKLLVLLSFDSQDKADLLENLVFRIGYDKVQGYLLKHPKINIYDLESVIKTDRKLRFEYQKLLEEIEMYFRSSLTYFITNKYDKKYKMANNSGHFYYRGYLNKSIFADRDDHYQLISQLNERIDMEIKNNNQQVEAEYHKYRYSLNFSTAAGIMTFGWVLNIFQVLNYYDKSEYLMRYFKGLSPQTFYAWMISLNNLRNKCAHYQSLYRLSSLKEMRPIMTKDIDSNENDRKFKSSSLFYYTLIVARLCPDEISVEDFIDNLSVLFRKAGRENFTFNLELDYSFPQNWQIILEKEKCQKTGRVL